MAKSGKKLRVTLVKSPFGTGKKHMATVRGLGLRRMHDSRELEDSPAVRGMVNSINFMLKCEEV